MQRKGRYYASDDADVLCMERPARGIGL